MYCCNKCHTAFEAFLASYIYGKGLTPFEAGTKEKQNLGGLRVVPHAHVAKDNSKKLDIKSWKCIPLGYGTDTMVYWL